MDEISATLILFGAGLAAGFLNVVAGGGSAITLPVLIFLGLDSATANGTNRVGILIQNISAVYSFKKEKYSQFSLSLKLSLFTLPGAVFGALIAISVGDDLFNKILAVIMIGIMITLVLPQKKVNYEDESNHRGSVAAYIALFATGFYGGFIQVGIGFLMMAVLHSLMRLRLLIVNMHKVFIILINTIPALLVFMIAGHVNWKLGLSLAAGNALGGWWAAKAQVKKGENFIKVFLIITMMIMSLKLFGLF